MTHHHFPRRLIALSLVSLSLAILATSCAAEDDFGTVANPQQSATPTPKPSDLTGGIVDD
ncbi:hypothetical protein J7643_06775 [bacterium]|nr:hypothetical protein [bacterium]